MLRLVRLSRILEDLSTAQKVIGAILAAAPFVFGAVHVLGAVTKAPAVIEAHVQRTEAIETTRRAQADSSLAQGSEQIKLLRVIVYCGDLHGEQRTRCVERESGL